MAPARHRVRGKVASAPDGPPQPASAPFADADCVHLAEGVSARVLRRCEFSRIYLHVL